MLTITKIVTKNKDIFFFILVTSSLKGYSQFRSDLKPSVISFDHLLFFRDSSKNKQFRRGSESLRPLFLEMAIRLFEARSTISAICSRVIWPSLSKRAVYRHLGRVRTLLEKTLPGFRICFLLMRELRTNSSKNKRMRLLVTLPMILWHPISFIDVQRG